MAAIAALVNRLKVKISSKLYQDNKWTGVLTGRRDQYLSCLQVDLKLLDGLLDLDHQHWLNSLRITKETIHQKQVELERLLTSQEQQLSRFFTPITPSASATSIAHNHSPSMHSVGPYEINSRFKLRKVPGWG